MPNMKEQTEKWWRIVEQMAHVPSGTSAKLSPEDAEQFARVVMSPLFMRAAAVVLVEANGIKNRFAVVNLATEQGVKEAIELQNRYKGMLRGIGALLDLVSDVEEVNVQEQALGA